MIHVLDRAAKTVRQFTGPMVTIRPCFQCLAPCCNLACDEHGPAEICRHSEHGWDHGLCVSRIVPGSERQEEKDLVSTEWECLATFPYGTEFVDCSCPALVFESLTMINPTVEICSHGQVLKEKLSTPGGRPAGLNTRVVLGQVKDTQ